MPLLAIALAVVVGAVLLTGGGGASRAPGVRTYSVADIPKLRELLLRKAYMGRELAICLQKQTEHSLFSTNQTLSFAVGLFTGVATLNPGAAMKAARATSEALDKVNSSDELPCAKELALTKQQLQQHDQLCAELGLPAEVTYEAVQAIVAQLGGLYANVDAEQLQTWDTWDRCVRASGFDSCLYSWQQEKNQIPPYDPKTGLALRGGTAAPAAASFSTFTATLRRTR